MNNPISTLKDAREIIISFNFLVVVFAFYLSGCAFVVPTAVPEQEPFEDSAIEFLTIGSTTREQVSAKLGEPALRRQNWWLYREAREGWAWIGCIVAYGGGTCATAPRGSEDYFLVVEFDDNDILERYDVIKEDILCEQRRFCYEKDLLTEAATEVEDLASKSYLAPPVGCNVYLYSDTDDDKAAGQVELDGRKVAALVGSHGFHHLVVSPGAHQLLVYPVGEQVLGMFAAKDLDCQDQQIEYLRYRYSWRGPIIEAIDGPQGRAAIEERWLAKPDAGPMEKAHTNWLQDGRVYVTVTGKIAKAHIFSKRGKPLSWGVSNAGEPCGMLAAIEDYGLAPLGGASNELFFHHGGHFNKNVQLLGICNAGGDCAFPSVIKGETCDSIASKDISFPVDGTLLVIEPEGESYSELYFNVAWFLRKHANCDFTTCTMPVAKLRELSANQSLD